MQVGLVNKVSLHYLSLLSCFLIIHAHLVYAGIEVTTWPIFSTWSINACPAQQGALSLGDCIRVVPYARFDTWQNMLECVSLYTLHRFIAFLVNEARWQQVHCLIWEVVLMHRCRWLCGLRVRLPLLQQRHFCPPLGQSAHTSTLWIDLNSKAQTFSYLVHTLHHPKLEEHICTCLIMANASNILLFITSIHLPQLNAHHWPFAKESVQQRLNNINWDLDSQQ